MRYVMVIYETPADLASRKPDEDAPYAAAWRLYYQALVEAGVYVTGGALKDSSTATTVQVRGNQRHVQDGPFVESKEQLGGFMILDCESLDAALDFAARCPAAVTGAVEVRPMDESMHETIIRA